METGLRSGVFYFKITLITLITIFILPCRESFFIFVLQKIKARSVTVEYLGHNVSISCFPFYKKRNTEKVPTVNIRPKNTNPTITDTTFYRFTVKIPEDVIPW